MTLPDHELFIAVKTADFRKKGAKATPPKTWKSGDAESAQDDAQKAEKSNKRPEMRKFRSSEIVAQSVGASTRMVEKIRTIIDHATLETIAAVEAGEIRIQAAYELSLRQLQIKKILAGKIPAKRPKAPKMAFAEIFREVARMGAGPVFSDPPIKIEDTKKVLNFVAEHMAKAGWIDEVELAAVRKAIKYPGCGIPPDRSS